MILTNCAACAAPLAHNAPRCVRCKLRYCNATCQHDHWRRGHKQMCKKIHRGGNAEQYNADKKYKEAVAVAVEACADDMKGQTCYICTQALHWKTKEGLVRGCACRGMAGAAHVSCLAEQAKILVAEGLENNLSEKARGERFDRWHTCSMCKQEYHGVVRCALGWACWKSYVGRPEGDWARGMAINQLGNGLAFASHHEGALSVRRAELAMLQRLDAPEHEILIAQSNISNTYHSLGRHEENMHIRRVVHWGFSTLLGEEHELTLHTATCYATTLTKLKHFEESRSLMRKMIPVSRRVLGEVHRITLTTRYCYGEALYANPGATLDDLREAVATLEDTERTVRRVFGNTHPLTVANEEGVRESRAALRARETPGRA